MKGVTGIFLPNNEGCVDSCEWLNYKGIDSCSVSSIVLPYCKTKSPTKMWDIVPIENRCLSLTAKQAMDALKIPTADQPRYMAKL